MLPYLMLTASAVVLLLAAYIWLRGQGRAMGVLALILLATGVWVGSIGGWSLSPTSDAALIWFRLQFLGVGAIPVLLFLYAVNAGGHRTALSTRHQLLLWLMPAATVLIALSPAFHTLLFEQVSFVREQSVMVLKSWTPGPWFLLHSSYSFSLTAVSLVMLARVAMRSYGIFRRQLALLLTAFVPVVLLTILNTFQIIPPDQLITPLGFLLMGLALVWGILRHRLISVVPVARDLLIDQMDDAMLVIDRGERVVDVNHALLTILDRQRANLLGLPLHEALDDWPELRQLILSAHHEGAEVELRHIEGDDPRQFDAQLRPLFVEGRPAGKLVVLHDISRLKRVQRDLFTLATTDALTGLNNRRQFIELARTQIAVATRERMRIALMLIDVDHFKHVNDQHGHAVGDLVLAVVARRIDDGLRRADVTCRYGGEEFATLLSNADAATAMIAAERVRGSVGGEAIVVGKAQLSVTVSIGVALGVAGDVELADLLLRADQALYSAKAGGRNRVVLSTPEGYA